MLNIWDSLFQRDKYQATVHENRGLNQFVATIKSFKYGTYGLSSIVFSRIYIFTITPSIFVEIIKIVSSCKEEVNKGSHRRSQDIFSSIYPLIYSFIHMQLALASCAMSDPGFGRSQFMLTYAHLPLNLLSP